MTETSFIRQDTDYAVRALIHLALAPDEKSTGSEVAASCRIPKSFAYKILKKMARSGLVDSKCGRTGGYRLSADPEKITLADVVTTMQGPVTMRRCLLESRDCPFSGECAVSAKWSEVQRVIADFLGRTTLQELVESFRESQNAEE
ncbi:MAG: RrF2 family transcriptional regulator [Planctomycetota bacterium]